MSDLVIDSSVVAKWILREPDSGHAQNLFLDSQAKGGRLIVLDLALPEVANAIWKRHHQRRITFDEARQFLNYLTGMPVTVEAAAPLLASAMEIALTHDRSIYDALFIALSAKMNLHGITADEPLYNAVHRYFPKIILLRSWQP